MGSDETAEHRVVTEERIEDRGVDVGCIHGEAHGRVVRQSEGMETNRQIAGEGCRPVRERCARVMQLQTIAVKPNGAEKRRDRHADDVHVLRVERSIKHERRQRAADVHAPLKGAADRDGRFRQIREEGGQIVG